MNRRIFLERVSAMVAAVVGGLYGPCARQGRAS